MSKNWISIAAASALAAGMMTGCGGSSSGGSNSTSTTAASSVEVVDGKVMNGVVTGYYVDENNDTQDIEFQNDRTYKDVVTDEIVQGSYVYRLPEANASLLDEIRYVQVEFQDEEVIDGRAYPATFIDSDGTKDYNETLDVEYPDETVFKAAKGAKYVSPVSTLVYEMAGGDDEFEKGEDLNDTVLDNAKKIAAEKLNLSTDDLDNVDPLSEGKEAFGFVNAMMAADDVDIADLAENLKKEEANASNFGAVINLLARNAGAGNIFETIKNQLDKGDLSEEDLASLDFDKTRENDGEAILNTETSTAFADINGTSVDGACIADCLQNTGDKIGDAGVLAFEFKPRKNDEDNKTAKADLYVQVGETARSVEGDTDDNKLVIKVSGLDINKTNGHTVISYDEESALTSYEWYVDETNESQVASNYVAMSDLNSSQLNVRAAFANDNEVDLGKLITTADANASGEASAKGYNYESDFHTNNGNIERVKVGLDSEDALQKVTNDGDPKKWTTVAIQGTGQEIVGEPKQILDLRADNRGDFTGKNAKPSIDTVTSDSDNVDFNGTGTTNKAADSDLLGTTLVINADQGDVNQTLTFDAPHESEEQNNTIKVSNLPAWITPAKTTLNAGDSDTPTLEVKAETNKTASSYTEASMAKFSITDEFGKAGDDVNVSFLMNRAPVAQATSYTFEANTSDSNLTNSELVVTDDRVYDLNITGGADVNMITYYGYDGANSDTIGEVNVSNAQRLTDNLSATLDTDGNIAWDVNETVGNTEGNFTVTFNVQDAFDMNSSDMNATIIIKK